MLFLKNSQSEMAKIENIHYTICTHPISSRDARPAPPRPGPGGNGCPGVPRPRKFSTLPRPAPEKCGATPPRPAPKIVPGQGSGQTFLHHHKVLGIKNFLAVFSALKVLFKDI